MALGGMLWFNSRFSGGSEFETLRKFESFGILSAHPGTSDIVFFRDFDEFHVKSEALISEADRMWPFTVKLWLGYSEDVLATFYAVSGIGVLKLNFRGLTIPEADRVASAAFWIAVNDVNSVAIVIDSTLLYSTEDWENYVVGGGAHPSWKPDLLWKREDGERSSMTVSCDSWLNREHSSPA